MHIFAVSMFWLLVFRTVLSLCIALGTSYEKERTTALLKLAFNAPLAVWGGMTLWGA